MDTKNKTAVQTDEIDLIVLAKTIWSRRKFVIKTVIVFVFIGLVIALLSPKKYNATTKMVPQVSDETLKMGGLSSLASMAGVNMNLGLETTDLSPQTYPQIVQSAPFQLQLMYTSFPVSEVRHPITLFEYYTAYQKPGIFHLIKKYTIGLPDLLFSQRKSEPDSTLDTKDKEPLNLTGKQEEVRKIMTENIYLEINDRDGYIQLNSRFHDPELAARVAQKARKMLQEYITEFKIRKATARLEFIEERYQEKKNEFERARTALAAFRDRNKNVTSAMALTEQEQLQNEYQLTFEVYSNLAQQLEQARIKVKEDTPLFSIIQPVTVPHEKSTPGGILILMVWFLLGGIAGTGWVIGKYLLIPAKKRWNEITA